MTVKRLAVLLQGQRIGTVERNNQGRLRFSYDDRWRTRPDATPLSTSMPLPVATHGHAVVDAFLWGLLPDNSDVLRRWGRRFQVSPANAFSLLGTPVGEDCAGAVQLVTEDRVEHARERGAVTWLADEDVAARLVELRRDTTAWLPSTTSGQFSLAGAQAKTALLHDPGQDRWGLPSGAVPTTHILKPAIRGLDEHDLNEHLCLAAARRLGVPAAITTVGRFGEQTAIVVRRYDRVQRDGRWLRVHQEDLCQAFGVPPTSKYQNEGGPSPEGIVRLLRERIQPHARGEEAVWRFLDGLALNWLLAGTDAHAKNYSLLLAGPEVRLAPLYDVASALPYDLDVKRLKMAMKIGGEYRLRLIGARHWKKLAAACDVDDDQLLQRLRELADRLPDALGDACKDDAVQALGSGLPARLHALASERATGWRAWLT